MLWMMDVGEGPPLVLLHPVGTSGSIWWLHVPRLAKRFRVLAVDLPGHGRSPQPKEPLSLEGMADDLYRALQSLPNLSPVHLLGLSLGGMVAQVFGVEHPSCVASLILCDTLCEVAPSLAAILEERARVVEKEGMMATAASTLDRWFAPGFSARHADVTGAVERLLLAADPSVNAQTWRAISHLSVASRLDTLKHVPTIVINGALDDSIPKGAGQRLADLLDARLVELPGCRHMAPLEAPEAFMDLVESFILRC